MAATVLSKRTLIDKSNSTIVIVAAVAAFVIVFCAVASNALLGQESYQGKVIQKQKAALAQLKADEAAAQNLVSSYKAFVSQPQNLIGGDPRGNGPQDGDNAKIVLDALPSSYDFPALATSLDGLITAQGLKVNSLSGTDDEVAQQANKPSSNPQPVTIPFQLSVSGPYAQIEGLVSTFEHSIRPIQITSIQLSGNQSNMSAQISAQTYYQPGKVLSITQESIQ